MQRAMCLAVVCASIAAIAVPACGTDESAPTASLESEATVQTPAITAVAGFYFLPPITAKLAAYPGVFDAKLSPVVRIDRVDAITGDTLEVIRTFRRHASHGERIRVSRKKQQYIARWQ